MSTDDKQARPPRRAVGEAIAIGIGIGIALGVTQDNVALGIGVGVAVAAAIGTARWQRSVRTDDPD